MRIRFSYFFGALAKKEKLVCLANKNEIYFFVVQQFNWYIVLPMENGFRSKVKRWIAMLGILSGIPGMINAQVNFDFQGHRGAMGLVPENTIPSMIKALELGVNTLELDVVISKDKKVVVSHEPYMSALFSSKPDGTPVLPGEAKSFNLYRMTYEEIRQWDVGARGNERFPRQVPLKVYKPLLHDLIDSVEKHVELNNLPLPFYNIEIKSTRQGDTIFHPLPSEFVNLVMEVVNYHQLATRVIIQSFDTRPLVIMREKFPEITLSLLVANLKGIERNIELLGFTPDIYSPFYKLVRPGLVREARAKGMKIIPWTVNDVNAMVRLIKLGVDGIISDYPDYFNDAAVKQALSR